MEKVLFSHCSDEWATPDFIYKRFIDDGYFDPCPLGGLGNALSIEWQKKNFVNPPYSDISRFVDKVIEELHFGNTSVLLVPARTDTRWFHKLLDHCDISIEFIKGRLHFSGKGCAPFPSLLIFVNGLKHAESSISVLSN